MLNNYPQKVGGNIRTYRKARGLSLAALAQKINKSKTTLSKYESGDISIDVMTLFEIACVLQVDMEKLVEHMEKPQTMTEDDANRISLPSKLYLYHSHHLKYHTSVIVLGTTTPDGATTATVYYRIVGSLEEYTRCTNIYHGELHYSDSNLHFILRNFRNKKDMIYMIFYTPIHITEAYPGLILGVQNTNMRPCAFRVILSSKPLSRASLEENLMLSREQLRKLKTGSYYSIVQIEE